MIIEGDPEDNRSRARKRGPRPQWWEYEQEVAQLVEELDSGTTVEHNMRVTGRVSGVKRQLDALVQGQVAGQPVTIVIEAKRYARKVSIGTIDEFIGKMLDVGCDRGVLYAAGGFSDAALSRASSARNPAVGCVYLAPTDGLLMSRVSPAELTTLEFANEEHLDQILGEKRTQEYDEWLGGRDVALYRH